jgi:hypothetical protein
MTDRLRYLDILGYVVSSVVKVDLFGEDGLLALEGIPTGRLDPRMYSFTVLRDIPGWLVQSS